MNGERDTLTIVGHTGGDEAKGTLNYALVCGGGRRGGGGGREGGEEAESCREYCTAQQLVGL